MRTHRVVTTSTALLAALLLTSSAFAAGKRAKPKHKAPAADTSADEAKKPDSAPSADPAPAPDSAASDTPPLTESAPPPDKPETHDEHPTSSSPTLGNDVALKAVSDTPSPSADAALTQREAARIASGRSEVAAYIGAGAGGRHFQYSDPVGLLLAPYRLPVAPLASFEMEAYPLAASNLPALRDLGFRGRICRAFALDSETPDGAVIDTSWTRFGGDVRYRVILPGSHRFELGILAGLDANYFVMSTTSKIAALVPSARTISARFGIDAELLAAGRFSFLLAAGYLAVTSPGEIYERFRDPHVAGIDATLGCSLGLAPGLTARLTGQYTRYFATFKPKVGDPTVAGGALDQLWQLGLGVRYAH